jgi:hypothetical protein
MALPSHILPMEFWAQMHWGEFHPFLTLMLDGFNKSTPKHYYLVLITFFIRFRVLFLHIYKSFP